MSHFLAQILLEIRRSSTSLEPFIDLLAYLEPELLPKKNILDKNQKVRKKAWVSHWRLARPAITRETFMLESYSNPQDSWSLVHCTEKEHFWDSDLGFLVDIVMIGEFFLFFSCMASSPGQWSEIVAQCLVGFLAVIWICRGLDRLPGVSGAKVMDEKPLISGKSLEH